MMVYETVMSQAIVINTYNSNVVNPLLKTAGIAYPDFGSGNLNHLIPRIKFAAADKYQISNFNDIDVTLATSHFHVTIPKVVNFKQMNQISDLLIAKIIKIKFP